MSAHGILQLCFLPSNYLLDVARDALALLTAVTFCVCEEGTVSFLTDRISSEANPGILMFQFLSVNKKEYSSPARYSVSARIE